MRKKHKNCSSPHDQEAMKSRQQWRESFYQDHIDLTHLPQRIVIKARQIIAALQEGVSLHQLRGKRFPFDRTLVRIPITYRYRMLCRCGKSGIIPIKVMSHEDYNAVARHRVSI